MDDAVIQSATAKVPLAPVADTRDWPAIACDGYDVRMDDQQIHVLARMLMSGQVTLEDFTARIRSRITADLGEAQLDLDRSRRCGYPEVVFAQGKSVETLEKIFRSLSTNNVEAFATRVESDKAERLLARFPTGRYNSIARTFRIPAPHKHASNPVQSDGRVVIVSAGTSDMPVAEEARETADWMGAKVMMIQDVGVAGPHRLPAHLGALRLADAIVVVAGMEGALPSVVGGYVDCPVIAVPTSVGYGASFGGVAALLGMLNSCAANVTVVNIDAGFKGGYLAALIANRSVRREHQPIRNGADITMSE